LFQLLAFSPQKVLNFISTAMASALTDASMTTSVGVAEPSLGVADLASVMCNEVVWFLAGFAMIRILIALGVMPNVHFDFKLFGGWMRGRKAKSKPRCSAAGKTICANADAGMHDAVIDAWHRNKGRSPLPVDALKAVTEAFAKTSPEMLIAEISAHLRQHSSALARTATMNALVDSLVRLEKPALAEELTWALRQALSIGTDARTHDLLLGGFATIGDERKVEEMLAQGEATTRGRLIVVKAFLKGGRVDAASQQVLEMHQRGLQVPPRAVTELCRVACDSGAEVLQKLIDHLGGAGVGRMPLSTESLALILLDCAQRGDLSTACRVARIAKDQNLPLSYNAYESLLKLHATVDSTHAPELFQAMQRDGFFATEGLCGSLLARCAESQNVRLAEQIAGYLRTRSMTTLATYKTLMKVYACGGMYEKACDLYDQVVADGLEPDHVMYGCLVKFAVKCGRTAFSHDIFEKVKGGDIQNYMWLIRAAGRDGNVDKALELLRRLQSSQAEGLDIAVYNCTLDVCVSNGDMVHAQELITEMRKAGMVNLVTYNTVMKGHCAKGDLPRARRILREMEAAGFQPDSASYNCMLSSAVAVSDLHEAWEVMAEMERKRVPLDHYTLSIMMKAARKARNPRDGRRALAVIDRAGVNVCEDDVLFNTVLDACIHLKDTERLGNVLEAFARSKIRPTVHTYGLLIKACSILRKVARCWELWKEMVEKRDITPNDITLSCMLDALVCSSRVEEAVALFQHWKEKVPPNTVMYSTLIKGYAVLGDSERAMEMYRELQGKGLQMNLVTYTTLIDAQCRAGNMDQATEMLALMEKNGCAPNTITYSTLVKGHCIQGNLEEALRLFQVMLDRGLTADTVIFNTMLDGCVRHSRFELADQLVSNMNKFSVEPSNFTLSIMVKMWGKRRRLDDAFAAIRQSLSERRFRLDSQVGTCLISACLHNRAADRAVEALAEMKTWSNFDGPDSGTYNALVSGLTRCGRIRQAAEFAKEFADEGPKASAKPLAPETMKLLFKSLHEKGLYFELGVPLARKLTDVSQGPAEERDSRTSTRSTAPAGFRGGRNGR
jgi:pentatricopeptide repeat protein